MFGIFNRKEEEERARSEQRLPPGQALTSKFPVLHYGHVPSVDLAKWDFKIWGEVEKPLRLTWEEVNRGFDEIGANHNAYTTPELTALYASVLPEYAGEAIDRLSDLLDPALREEDFETERKVILEEIAMCEDEPDQRLCEAATALHFGSHPLGRRVMGSRQTVSRMTREAMLDHFRRYYGPGNAVLAMTGRMDFGRLVERASGRLGEWKPAEAVRRDPPRRFEPRRQAIVDPRLNRTYVMGIMPAPHALDDRRFAARVLADVIGDSDGSRLYWSLIDKAVAEDAELGFTPYDGTGCFGLFLVCDPDRADEAMRLALDELRRVRHDLDEAELSRARSKLASAVVLAGESPLGRLNAIGMQWAYRSPYRSVEADLAIVERMTLDDLRAVMRDFPFEPLSLVSLGPDAAPRV